MDIESQKEVQQLPLSTSNYPQTRPRTPILKLKTDLSVYHDETSTHPEASPDAWDWPITLRQLTALFLFTLQLLITTSWQPGLLSLAIPISSSFLLIVDAIITCSAVSISSYVHFCIASLDYEPVWGFLPWPNQAEATEAQRRWTWKPRYFYIMAIDETVILVAAASTGLQNVCLWALLVVTAGSWYLGWRLRAVQVMSSRLWRAKSWRFC
ncbi:hypothetical protein QBC36DRAFT_289988 [Triangularia setosa]|uniref:Uncharacterized protein n=1 Tax=Triangularia setosa TaxID=2587417 RepID=A0AAN7A886_9PEZI|nr:hypothetical protein QBC36DRAFT_289988 [Podospora setosa]